MDAYLFEGAAKSVHILPEAIAMGGSWEGNIGRVTPIAWESHLVKRVHDFLKDLPDAVLVDVGANTGSYGLLPVLLPNLSVCAFEPNPTAREVLVKNAHLNHLNSRFAVFPVALADKRGMGMLSLPEAHASGCATLGAPVRFRAATTVPVMLAALDDMTWGKPVRFLKIDTEGAEKFVLQGAKDTIARFRPTMLIECVAMNTAAFGYDPAETIALVESYGYKIEWCSSEDIWATPL